MTLGELMQHVLRLQRLAEEVGAAFANYADWRADVPGEGGAFCVATLENISFTLDMVRDTLRDEMRATTQEPIADTGE